MSNYFKPRYKLAFKTKTIIWAYKNSRLRRFFDLRGRIRVRKGFLHRSSLVLRSLKWLSNRRFFLPYRRKKSYKKFLYKNKMYMKQKIIQFYGKFDEQKFRLIFMRKYNAIKNNKIENFFAFLEKRLDVIIFRMKILPTIFACNQYISHSGIFVNNKLITFPNYVITVGDIISIPEKTWHIFFSNILYKLSDRYHRALLTEDRWYKKYNQLKFWRIRCKHLNLKKRYMFRFLQFIRDFKVLSDNINKIHWKILKISKILHRIKSRRKKWYLYQAIILYALIKKKLASSSINKLFLNLQKKHYSFTKFKNNLKFTKTIEKALLKHYGYRRIIFARKKLSAKFFFLKDRFWINKKQHNVKKNNSKNKNINIKFMQKQNMFFRKYFKIFKKCFFKKVKFFFYYKKNSLAFWVLTKNILKKKLMYKFKKNQKFLLRKKLKRLVLTRQKTQKVKRMFFAFKKNFFLKQNKFHLLYKNVFFMRRLNILKSFLFFYSNKKIYNLNYSNYFINKKTSFKKKLVLLRNILKKKSGNKSKLFFKKTHNLFCKKQKKITRYREFLKTYVHFFWKKYKSKENFILIKNKLLKIKTKKFLVLKWYRLLKELKLLFEIRKYLTYINIFITLALIGYIYRENIKKLKYTLKSTLKPFLNSVNGINFKNSLKIIKDVKGIQQKFRNLIEYDFLNFSIGKYFLLEKNKKSYFNLIKRKKKIKKKLKNFSRLNSKLNSKLNLKSKIKRLVKDKNKIKGVVLYLTQKWFFIKNDDKENLNLFLEKHLFNFIEKRLLIEFENKKLNLISTFNTFSFFSKNFFQFFNSNRFLSKYEWKRKKEKKIISSLLKKKIVGKFYNKKKNYLKKFFWKKKNNFKKFWKLKRFLVGKNRIFLRRKKTFRYFQKKPYWFIPSYIEMDFITLTGCLIQNPKINEILYPFNCSLKNLVSFYKNRGF